MKKLKQLSLLLIVACSMLIPSCKKKSNDPELVTPPPIVANTLCDGNNSTSFYPMVLNNTWGYTYKIYTQQQTVHPSLKVTGTTTHNLKNYFEITDQNSVMFSNPREYREDATTHNIYFYDNSWAMEYLNIPASPTLNQSWAYTNNTTRKVTNLSASLSTGSCSYTGLLEISIYNNSNVLQEVDYYKKGIGMVGSKMPDSFFGGFDTFNIDSITLH